MHYRSLGNFTRALGALQGAQTDIVVYDFLGKRSKLYTNDSLGALQGAQSACEIPYSSHEAPLPVSAKTTSVLTDSDIAPYMHFDLCSAA